jgi:integrase
MSRSSRIPSYRHHKQSGQAIVTLPDGAGGRRDVLLGPYDTPESRTEYARVIGEWEARGRRLFDDAAEPKGLSVNELLVAFLEHAERHYRRPDGTLTSEVKNYKLSVRPLRELYGTLPAAEFSPLKLKVVRQKMTDMLRYRVRFKLVEDEQEKTVERHVWEWDFRQADGATQARWQGQWYAAELLEESQALSRGLINQRIGRIVRAFKWGVGEELVPESVWRALTTVRGLEKGRSPARETEEIKPVAAEIVEATLPFALPPVRAMAQLQLLTGMRPGEVCALRGCDLDASGDVWLYRPQQHKTRHKGKERVIAFGPKAQAVVKAFLTLDMTAHLFNPRAALEERNAEKRRRRKTRVQPSQQKRRTRSPERQPREFYDPLSYAHAITWAVRRANTAAACKPCKALKPEERCPQCQAAAIPHWHPHQLRHTHATEVRRRFGLEAAQVALGHSGADVTQIYAERDTALAAKVAKEIG